MQHYQPHKYNNNYPHYRDQQQQQQTNFTSPLRNRDLNVNNSYNFNNLDVTNLTNSLNFPNQQLKNNNNNNKPNPFNNNNQYNQNNNNNQINYNQLNYPRTNSPNLQRDYLKHLIPNQADKIKLDASLTQSKINNLDYEKLQKSLSIDKHKEIQYHNHNVNNNKLYNPQLKDSINSSLNPNKQKTDPNEIQINRQINNFTKNELQASNQKKQNLQIIDTANIRQSLELPKSAAPNLKASVNIAETKLSNLFNQNPVNKSIEINISKDNGKALLQQQYSSQQNITLEIIQQVEASTTITGPIRIDYQNQISQITPIINYANQNTPKPNQTQEKIDCVQLQTTKAVVTPSKFDKKEKEISNIPPVKVETKSNVKTTKNSSQLQKIEGSSIKPKITKIPTIIPPSIQRIKLIGKGKFSQVHLVREKNSNCLFAEKIISKKTLIECDMLDQAINEIKFCLFVQHPNIIKTFGFFTDENSIYLIQEYSDGGDMYAQLQSKKEQGLTEHQCAQWINQICKGIQYLHNNNIMHRDIKPENILLSQNLAKIGDLGCAAIVNKRRRTFCGTIDYISPEVIEGEEQTEATDVWSLGIMIFELIMNYAPFQYKSQEETFNAIKSESLSLPNQFSPLLQDLLRKMLEKNFNKRISIDQVINHNWLKEYGREKDKGRLEETVRNVFKNY